jgi:tetratricopeptide (TPR) repeat protein
MQLRQLRQELVDSLITSSLFLTQRCPEKQYCPDEEKYMRRVLYGLLVMMFLVACGSKEERRDEFFRNALRFEEQKQLAEARVEAKNVIKLDPNHGGAYLLLARCAMKEQNWREAFANFQRVTELEPNNSEAHLGLGRLYLLSGDTNKAEDAANQVLRLDTTSVDGRLLRAGAMLRAKRFDEAQAQLAEVFGMNRANEDAFLALSVVHAEQGRSKEALTTVHDGLILNPDSKALHFRAASLAADNGDYATAQNHLQRLRQLDPDNRGIMLLLASLYERMGESSRVEGILRDLLAQDPSSEEARLRLVEFLARQNKPDAATTLINQAPGGPTPRLRLALTALKLATGQMQEAENLLTTLAEDPKAGPVGLDARLHLAEILLQKGLRDQALGQIDQVLARNAGDARAHGARGRILMTMERFEEALGEFRIVLKDAPDDLPAVILMARSHLALGNTLSGQEGLRAFLARKPEALPVRLELTAYLERQGQPDEALSVLRDGATNGTTPPQLLLAMGEIEARREGFAAAERFFLQAANMDSARPAALLRLGTLFASTQDWGRAQSVFNELLRDNPDAHAGAEGLVAVQFAAGQLEGARTWARSRAQSRPQDALAADLWGRAALRVNDTAEAEAAFLEAQSRAPQWSAPSARLAALYERTGRRDAAISQSRAALSRNPESIPEAMLLGQLLQLAGNLDEAETIYRNLLTRHPGVLPAANNLAYLLVTRPGVTPEALREALTLATTASRSEDPTTLDTLGWIHYRMGDKVSALERLRKAHEALPEDATVAYHLAQVLADDGQNAEAKALLKKVLASETPFADLDAARELFKRL